MSYRQAVGRSFVVALIDVKILFASRGDIGIDICQAFLRIVTTVFAAP
jgi:hypothetical protein